MSEPAKKDDRVYTYADYYRWPDDERWELIDGVAYDMSPAPNRGHQDISVAISSELFSFLKDKPCHVYAAPFDVRLPDSLRIDRKQGNPNEVQHRGPTDRPHSSEPVKLPSDDEITTVVQPDISVFCNEAYLDERGAIGPPEIAIEILSPYTSVKDQREKLDLYERFGVSEYWVVDPANRLMWVYRHEAQTAASDRLAAYGRPEIYGPDETFESRVLDGFVLKLSELFAS